MKILRAILIAILISLGVGLAIGTFIRLRLERPVYYIGSCCDSHTRPPEAVHPDLGERTVVFRSAATPATHLAPSRRVVL
jgi:hypothetical protein